MEDSTSELEGGEIGSGHSAIALLELKTNKKDSSLLHKPFAHITLQYKTPGSDEIIKQQFSALYEPSNIEAVDTAYRFAAAVAMFGSILRQSQFVKGHSYEDVWLLAKNSANQLDTQQKEFVTLVEKAIMIYHPPKKKKKKKDRRIN
ncbi:MAG: hypothetical protein NVS3B15_10150 [Sediminibacterium sp.]